MKAVSLGRGRVYASSETHHSIVKAAALLGIGRENVRLVEVDKQFKMRTDDLLQRSAPISRRAMSRSSWWRTPGTVNTGAVDRLPEVGEIANRHDLWLHVDGSYGAFAILAQSVRTSSPESNGRIQSRSIRISGFICQWMSAA